MTTAELIVLLKSATTAERAEIRRVLGIGTDYERREIDSTTGKEKVAKVAGFVGSGSSTKVE